MRLHEKIETQMRWKHVVGVVALVCCNLAVNAQGGAIQLQNPSFEDFPRHSKPPRDWYDCGFPGETPPDVQPDPAFTFQVSKPAVDGETYLGLVVRDNDTWESVSQRLSAPMEKGKCYEFSIYLAKSPMYVSSSRTTDETANYTTPVKLRVYGGFGNCDKQYLLGETKVINHDRWLQYNFLFEPIGNYTYIVLEAFYQTPTLFPYNGNILIDHASAIVPVPCKNKDKKDEVGPTQEVQQPLANATPKTGDKKTTQNNNQAANDKQQVKKPAEQPVVPKEEKQLDIATVKRADLKEGSTIRINNLFFQVNKAIISEESNLVLGQIHDFMRNNSDVIVEIGGHTNGLCDDDYCNKLSSDRAKSVADYLISRGIHRDRVRYKGYGKTRPIATNRTPDGRAQNQRVEIKVLGFKKEGR
jgi:outer membrane protein OmpA-like peptidoglycan-associated protein